MNSHQRRKARRYLCRVMAEKWPAMSAEIDSKSTAMARTLGLPQMPDSAWRRSMQVAFDVGGSTITFRSDLRTRDGKVQMRMFNHLFGTVWDSEEAA